ncbi:MAG: hypothetical protein WC438_02145 [Candidatus Pacearchaeota archaeon]
MINKKAMSLSVVLLVIMTLILVIISLVYFEIRDEKLNQQIKLGNLDRVYAKEQEINFYLNEIMSSDNFQREFVKYRDNLEPALDNVRYTINGNEVVFDVLIQESNDNIEVNYNYQKIFKI